MSPPADVFPKAFRRVEGKQFLELARKLHWGTMQLTPLQTRCASGYGWILTRIKPVEPSWVMKPLAQPLPG